MWSSAAPPQRLLVDGGNLCLDHVNNRWFSEGAKVTELVALASDNLAHDTAHDL